MRSDIVPGGIFPHYELPDHTGKLRKVSEEHQQHLELAAFYPKIAVAYT
jgi:hypothetical protein